MFYQDLLFIDQFLHGIICLVISTVYRVYWCVKRNLNFIYFILFIYLFRACSYNQTSSHTISVFTIQHMAEKGTGEANSLSESRPYFPQNAVIHSFISHIHWR